jgi:hypothetical protein
VKPRDYKVFPQCESNELPVSTYSKNTVQRDAEVCIKPTYILLTLAMSKATQKHSNVANVQDSCASTLDWAIGSKHCAIRNGEFQARSFAITPSSASKSAKSITS